MRTTTTAAVLASLCASFALSACGGEEPMPPQPPPPPSAAPAPLPPAASTTEAPPPPPPKPTLADLVPQTLKNIGDAINAHDSAKFAANFTDDVTADIYGMGHVTGRSDYGKMLQGHLDAFGDIKCAHARVWTKDSVAILEETCAGSMTGDFMGMKATKKPVGHNSLIVAWFNDDGLVKQVHEYFDGPGMMMQMRGDKMAPPVPTLPSGPTEMHTYKGAADDKLVDLAKTVNDTFNKNDVKAIDAWLTPDADVTFFFAGGKHLSGKELRDFSAGFIKAAPQAKWSIANAWGIDGYLVMERTVEGIMKGRLGPMPPTNKSFTNHVGEIMQPTAGGKLQHGWVYGNMAEMMPPPPPPGAAPPPPPKPAAPKPAAPKPTAPKPTAPPPKKAK